jgi:hypothetical protein
MNVSEALSFPNRQTVDPHMNEICGRRQVYLLFVQVHHLHASTATNQLQHLITSHILLMLAALVVENIPKPIKGSALHLSTSQILLHEPVKLISTSLVLQIDDQSSSTGPSPILHNAPTH